MNFSPFAIEYLGKMGKEANAFLNRMLCVSTNCVGEIAIPRMKILRVQIAHAHRNAILQRLLLNSTFQAG